MTNALQIAERTELGACPECGIEREWLADDQGTIIEDECPECGSSGIQSKIEKRLRPTQAASRLLEVEAELGKSLTALRAEYVTVRALLREIRDTRLYLAAGFETFDEYTAQRWELTRRHVDRLIAWDEVAEATQAAGLPAPERESHARELADLEPEIAAEIWKETIAEADDQGTAVTAKAVRAKREEMLGRKSPIAKAEERENAREARLSSESNEWYTPPEYVDAVRELFGGNIDLDPASCAEANEWIQAGTIYTKDDDGLEQPWFGRAFNNPPNGLTDDNRSQQGAFAERMVDQYRNNELEEGVLFVNASTGAQWFQTLFRWPICFVAGRPNHIRPKADEGKPTDRPTHYRAFIYVGPRHKWTEFAERFSRFGYVHQPSKGDQAYWADVAAARAAHTREEE